MPSIKCRCGKQLLVREGQAGTTVVCECGQPLIVPGLRLLRCQELDGEPLAGILPDEGSTPAAETPVALADRQFLVFLTHPQILPNRISFDAASHFVTACDRLLQRYFEEVGRHWHVDLQVSLALLPNGETLVDIQVRPPIIPAPAIAALVDQLRQMPRPPVANGPVAFTIRKPMWGGAPRTPVFDIPFRDLTPRPANLDQLLMEAGGLTWSAATDAPSERRHAAFWSRFQVWWQRFRARAHLPAQQQPSPDQEPIQPPNLEQQEIIAALQSDSIVQVAACLERHPHVLPLYHYLGQLHVNGGDYQQAAGVFSQLIERDPGNLAAYAARGRAHVMAGSMQRGLADYTVAIEGNPADAESRAARAMIYLELEAWEFAEQDLTSAIELAPIQPQLYVERARVRYAQQKIGDVLQDLQLVHRLDPYHVEAYMLHGWTLQHRPNATLQDIADATEQYGHAIQIEPQNPAYCVQRAEAYASQSKFAMAIADCDRALQLDENSAIAHGIRGYANQQLDNHGEAVIDCSKAIELGLRSAAVYVSRAVGYAATGEIDRALSDCDIAVELAPDYAAAFNYRGMLRLGQGDIASATEDFAEACRLAPEWSTPREYRADAHRMQAEFEQAIDQYTRTIELEPGNLTAYIGRALAWMEKEQLEQAWQDLTEAIRIDEECAQAYFHRAELLLRQEQFQRTLTDLDKAISIDPNFAPGYHTRGQVYLHLQMNEQAMRDFSKLIELHPTWPGAYLGARTLGSTWEIRTKPARTTAKQPVSIPARPKS